VYKDIEKLKFHVFTTGKDEYTKTEAEAKQIINQWREEGLQNFRIYSCHWEPVEGIYEDIEGVYFSGSFPA